MFMILARNRYCRPKSFMFRSCNCGPRKRSWEMILGAKRADFAGGGGEVSPSRWWWWRSGLEKKTNALLRAIQLFFLSLSRFSFLLRSGNKRKRIYLKSISRSLTSVWVKANYRHSARRRREEERMEEKGASKLAAADVVFEFLMASILKAVF